MSSNLIEAFEVIADHPLFSGLDVEILTRLRDEMRLVELEDGEVLLEQGAEADCLYALVSGRLRCVIVTDEGGEQVVGDRMPPDVIGEMALLSGQGSFCDGVRGGRGAALAPGEGGV